MQSSRVLKAVADPGLAAAWLSARVHYSGYTTRMTKLARRAGLRRPVFVLSFDCDTDRDSDVLGRLHARLRGAGLWPAYAATGEVMQASAAAYADLVRDGAELLNHGFRRHAARDLRTGDVVSTFFYNGATPELWMADLRQGHEAVTAIAGRPPRGFRTPHFGTFDSPSELDALWRELARLGYLYSSSTKPLTGWRYGPAFRRHGVCELPVSGCPDRPAQIVDSWGLVRATGSSLPLLDALEAYRRLMAKDVPLLLNMYLDPADVAGDDAVLAALAGFATFDRGGFIGALAELEAV